MPKVKHRIRLLISYNGLKYYGWQKQTSLPTIQGRIEQALKNIFQEDISVVGAGRTDTGAHALGQNAHFDIPVFPRPNLRKALNSFLVPEGICICQIWKAPDDFHALHSATEKHYAYFILNRPFPCVFRKGQIHLHPHPIKIKILQSLGQKIQGRHDFKSFQNTGTSVKSTIRTVTSARWLWMKKDLLAFHIKGEGFLKQMIRNLVGTQIELLKEKDPIKKWNAILSAKDRKAAYATIPAKGLYLYQVSYPLELDRKCQKI